MVGIATAAKMTNDRRVNTAPPNMHYQKRCIAIKAAIM